MPSIVFGIINIKHTQQRGMPSACALPHPVTKHYSIELKIRLGTLLREPFWTEDPNQPPPFDPEETYITRNWATRQRALKITPPKCSKRIVCTGVCVAFTVREVSRLTDTEKAGSDMRNSHFSGRSTSVCLNFDRDHVKHLLCVRRLLIAHRGFIYKTIPCTLHLLSHLFTQSLF